jgi:hypothetical protein
MNGREHEASWAPGLVRTGKLSDNVFEICKESLKLNGNTI